MKTDVVAAGVESGPADVTVTVAQLWYDIWVGDMVERAYQIHRV